MKYGFLLQFLRVLVYVKRFFWWLGRKIAFLVSWPVRKVFYFLAYLRYKIDYFLKKWGLGQMTGWLGRRDAWQFFALGVLLILAWPQSRFYTQQDTFIPGQKTLAFKLINPGQNEVELEEINLVTEDVNTSVPESRSMGVVSREFPMSQNQTSPQSRELSGIFVGGQAVFKPTLINGGYFGGPPAEVEEYIIEDGDSLSTIAGQFGVSIATVLWENNLSLRSILRPGVVLRIPPATGVMHTVKKGDSLSKIAKLYEAETNDIAAFNHLKPDGSDLVIGEKIMVPDGVKAQQRALAAVTIPKTNNSAILSRVAIPAGSRQTPQASGFVWPSGSHTVTQYFSWSHNALDIAGPFQTPSYAAKAGTVEKAQCGWNGGYGCYVIINHGNGIKTLYGHHSKLLVTAGEHVETGQVIALMGNTGNVRGRTGIHVHFEVIVNGTRVNPLGYVK